MSGPGALEPVLTLRMLLDGARGAGRSSVLRLLAEQNYVPVHREPCGPDAALEWLSFATGRFEGAPIRIEAFCAAGAFDRRRRRRARCLVDVVAFVVDGTPAGVAAARRPLEEVQADLAAAGEAAPAVLLIAHKQDLLDAASADEVAERLGLAAEVVRAKTSLPQGGAAYAFALGARSALVRLRRLDAAGQTRRTAWDAADLVAALDGTPPCACSAAAAAPAPPATLAPTRRSALSRLIAALRG